MGKQRDLYKIMERIKGGRVGAADLTGVNLEEWLKHFKALFGEEKAKPVPASITSKLTW